MNKILSIIVGLMLTFSTVAQESRVDNDASLQTTAVCAGAFHHAGVEYVDEEIILIVASWSLIRYLHPDENDQAAKLTTWLLFADTIRREAESWDLEQSVKIYESCYTAVEFLRPYADGAVEDFVKWERKIFIPWVDNLKYDPEG